MKWDDINITIDRNNNNGNAWEYIDWDIYLYPKSMWLSDHRDTVIHELIHAILDKYYYVNTSTPVFSKEIEEQLVNILSSELDKNWEGIASFTKLIKK